MSLEVVWFERRGGMHLGAVTGGGSSKVVLLDEDGSSVRLPRHRVLHTLEGRVPGGSPQATREQLRDLRAQSEGVDEDLLWSSLEDDRSYPLAELASLYFGQVEDAQVAELVKGLTVAQTGRLASSFRLVRGAIQRVDAKSRASILERVAREAAERERCERFVAWVASWGQGGPQEGGAVTPELEEGLDALRSFALAADRCPGLKAARALARALEWGGADQVLAELEGRGVLPRHVNEVVARRGLRVAFSGPARDQARALVEQEIPRGEDLTGLPTVAIDDAGTREVDDALSAWEEDGQQFLAVHIARAADLVPQDSPLDAEALKRATTVYFPGDAVFMLPHDLVEQRLSLEAGVERPALSLICPVGPDGLPGPGRFVRSTIRVDARATYEVDDGLAGSIVQQLEPVARAARAAREQAGAATLSLPALKVTLDAEGEPVLGWYGVGLTSSDVVSELMVLYNARVAQALAEAGASACFRRQGKPVVVKVAEDDPLFALKARRSMPPTSVDPTPGPHKTMGLEAYTQATSPIRRYGDLVAQRQLLAVLEGETLPYSRDAIDAVRETSDAGSRLARLAEDERRRYWISRWFQLRRGDVLAGVVSRAGARGSVYLPDLSREFPCAGAGELKVGTRVEVRIVDADPRARSVSLELDATPQAGP